MLLKVLFGGIFSQYLPQIHSNKKFLVTIIFETKSKFLWAIHICSAEKQRIIELSNSVVLDCNTKEINFRLISNLTHFLGQYL